MSRSYGSERLTLALAAIGAFIFMVAVVFAIVSGQYAKIHQVNARYQQTAEQDRAKTAQEVQQACAGIQPPAFAECLAEKMKAYDRQQTSNKDLQAQQDMALWAFWAALCSGLGVFVTGIGIFFVWQTLEANRAAIKVANDAVSTTREIGDAQLRAYVSVDRIHAEFGFRPSSDAALVIEITLKNTGQTPAVSTAIRTELGIIKDKFVQIAGKQTDAHQVIGANGTRSWVMDWTVKTDRLMKNKEGHHYALFQLNVMYDYLDFRQRKWSEAFEYRCATLIMAPMEIEFSSASGLGFGKMAQEWGG